MHKYDTKESFVCCYFFFSLLIFRKNSAFVSNQILHCVSVRNMKEKKASCNKDCVCVQMEKKVQWKKYEVKKNAKKSPLFLSCTRVHRCLYVLVTCNHRRCQDIKDCSHSWIAHHSEIGVFVSRMKNCTFYILFSLMIMSDFSRSRITDDWNEKKKQNLICILHTLSPALNPKFISNVVVTVLKIQWVLFLCNNKQRISRRQFCV